MCKLYRSVCSTLDCISFKLRIKYGAATNQDYQEAQKAVNDLEYHWVCAGISKTQKFHGLVKHAANQMIRIGGIGDMLENDVEHVHQISSRLESRDDRLKNENKLVSSLTKMEAIGFHRDVEQIITQSNQKQSVNSATDETKKKKKIEWDDARICLSKELNLWPFSALKTSHEIALLEYKKRANGSSWLYYSLC